MAKVKVSRIEGARELDNVLKRLGPELAKRELQSATRAGATVIAREARRQAPRGADPSPASGQYGPLHRNIRTAKRRRIRPGAAGYIVHTGRAFWGAFIEFGTAHIAPNPWFTRAFEASRARALERLGERLRKGIDKRAAELAGRFKSITKGTRRRL